MRRPLLLFALAAVGCHALPQGKTGAEAEALAHRIEIAVHVDAWARTGAVRFTFRGSTEHLWDKTRNFDRVRFRGDDEMVLLDVGRHAGRAYKRGRELSGEAKDKLVEKAWKRFCNDTFWLNPLAKLFDDGVTRSRIADKHGESLIVHYASGGVTPGDTYQWLMGANDLPRAWRLFVKIIGVKGLEFSWQAWVPLSTGALISTEHRTLGTNAVWLSDVAGAETLAQLEPGADPFAPIAAP
jgi:hypothetical protein